MNGWDHNKIGRATCGIILLLLLLMPVHALTVNVPSSVSEGDILTAELSGPGMLVIRQNGQVVHAGTGQISYQWQTDSESAGNYLFSFETDYPGETNETRTVVVQNKPLEVEILDPSGTDLSDSEIYFRSEPNWLPELCWVNIDGVSNTLPSLGDGTYGTTISVEDGIHELDFKCKLGSETVTESKTVVVDGTPPVILTSGPSGEQTVSHVVLYVETDEISLCRYDTQDSQYGAMSNSFGSTYALLNQRTIPIANQGAQTFFVRCKDIHGNEMSSSSVISFTTKIIPSTEISIEGEKPLKAGTYKVKLKINTLLSETPSLSYRLEQSGTTRTIGLIGSGEEWEGFLVVPDNSLDSVISFNFEGKSLEGVTGSEITKGGLIEIDTRPPSKVDAVSLTEGDGRLVLKWVLIDEEEGVEFNIYKSSAEGVDYADLLTTVDGDTYSDISVSGAEYYYYRIAAVDKAGNVGELSDEVFGSGISDIVERSQQLDTFYLSRLDQAITQVTTLLFSVNKSISEMEAESNQFKTSIITDMQLIGKAKKSRLELETHLDNLRKLRKGPATVEQAEQILEELPGLINDAKKNSVSRINIVSQADANQPVDIESLQRNLPYGMLNLKSKIDEESYLKEMIGLNEHLTVSLNAKAFTIWDGHGRANHYSFVRKTVSLDEPLSSVRIIEVIPKEFSESANEITFTEEPVVLEDDPVLQYSYSVLERESFSYYVNRIVSPEEAKKSRTLVFAEPSMSPGNLVTGNVVDETPFVPSTQLVLIVLGIFVIISLGAYYVSLGKEEPAPFHGLPPVGMVQQQIQVKAPTKQKIIIKRDESFEKSLDRFETPVDVRALLREAMKEIDAKKYPESLSAYKQVLERLKSDSKLHDELHEEAQMVYRKLLLYKRLDDTRVAIAGKNKLDAEHALSDSRRLASEIGDEDTTLINDAKTAYTNFVKNLNNLTIQDMEKY